MKTSILVLSLFLIPSTAAWAQIEQKSKGAVTHSPLSSTFKADLKEGFHFNEKAPNKVVIDDKTFQPKQVFARKIEFLNLPKVKKSAKASLFVCDDGLTTCEMHAIELGGKKSAAKQAAVRAPDFGKKNEHGFIVDDLQQALTLAAKQKALVLVDFSARWCPSCVRLETEIFTLPEFKKTTENIIKVKIDTDRFENIVVAEKFKIVGIPTMLVINSKQEEIDRIVDYQPMAQLRDFFASVQSNPTPIAELMQKGASGDQKTRLTLGLRLLASGKTAESVEILSLLNSPPKELWDAKIQLASENAKRNPEKKSEKVAVLTAALAAEDDSSRSIAWRSDLVALLEHDPEQQKKLVTEGVALADQLLSDKEKMHRALRTDRVGEFTDFEPLMIAMYRADLVESGEGRKETPSTIEAWSKAASTGTLLNIDAKHEGTALRYLLVLTKAQLWTEADALAVALLAKNPKNVDVKRRRLRILHELKNYNQAIVVGKEVLKESYGRNEFWVAEALAKTYLAAKKKKEARALIERYLSRSEIDWSNLESSKKKLQEMKQQTL